MEGRQGDPTGAPDRLQLMLDAIASPVRREILWLVWTAELAAGEIAASFALTAPTISVHLRVLRTAGLVTMRQDGTFRRYRANHEALRTLAPLLGDHDDRWGVADDMPERRHAVSEVATWVTAAVALPAVPAEEAFACFADGARYSRWLGVPVTIADGRFAADMEWGLAVRGRYEVVAEPQLIAMLWDFEDHGVPVPGGGEPAYLRVTAEGIGSHVEIHQRATGAEQQEFFRAAWSTVLGRLYEYWAAEAEGKSLAPREPRPKRRALRATNERNTSNTP